MVGSVGLAVSWTRERRRRRREAAVVVDGRDWAEAQPWALAFSSSRRVGPSGSATARRGVKEMRRDRYADVGEKDELATRGKLGAIDTSRDPTGVPQQ